MYHTFGARSGPTEYAQVNSTQVPSYIVSDIVTEIGEQSDSLNFIFIFHGFKTIVDNPLCPEI